MARQERLVSNIISAVKDCGAGYTKQECGNSWVRLFILNKRKCTIGRISIDPKGATWVHPYKPDYLTTINDDDHIFINIRRLLEGRGTLSPEDFARLEIQAEAEVVNDLFEKEKWRKDHPIPLDENGKPKRRRKALKGRNPRSIFLQLAHKLKCDYMPDSSALNKDEIKGTKQQTGGKKSHESRR